MEIFAASIALEEFEEPVVEHRLCILDEVLLEFFHDIIGSIFLLNLVVV